MGSELRKARKLSGPVVDWLRHWSAVPPFRVRFLGGALVGLAAGAACVSDVAFVSACLSFLIPPLSPLSCLSTVKAKRPKNI